MGPMSKMSLFAPPEEKPSLFNQIGEYVKGNPDLFNRLAIGFNTMRLDPDPQLARSAQTNLLLNRQKRERDLAGNRTAEWLRSQGQTAMADLVKQNPELGGQMLLLHQKGMMDAANKESFVPMTSEQLAAMGYSVEPGKTYNVSSTGRISQVGGGGVNITNQGNIPAGYRLVTGADGSQSMEPIPGSPAAQEAAALAEKAAGRQEQKSTAATTVIQDINRLIDIFPRFNVQSGPDSGMGMNVLSATSRKVLGAIPGTPEYAAEEMKKSITSNIGVDQLQQMRDNSPTGGALGNVTQQQQARLEGLLGSLELGQDIPVLEDNARRVANIYLDIVHGTRRERMAELEAGRIDIDAFRAIESLYQPLTFDSQGRQFDISKPPPGWDNERVPWDNVSEQTRLRAWNRHEALNGY